MWGKKRENNPRKSFSLSKTKQQLLYISYIIVEKFKSSDEWKEGKTHIETGKEGKSSHMTWLNIPTGRRRVERKIK